jgi:transglutaminase-like putative cysteine protease
VFAVLMLPRLPYSDLTVAPGLVDWRNVGNWGNSRLEVRADVGDYLDSGRDAALLRVRTSEPLRWRGGTLDHFDGIQWTDTTEPGDDDGEEIVTGVPTRYVEQRFEVLNARTELVFGGYKIVGTSLDGAEQNIDGSFRAEEPLERGASYRVVSQVPQPTPRQLRGAGEAYPAGVRERFLQMPEDVPEVVPETARAIDRRYDPATPYDTARAIEQYLRFDGGFIYNLEADYRRADRALEDFLSEDGDREGFCTQFATSMALLARDRGIPSRVVYGATQGRQTDLGEYLVTGANMHTWVELYFPGVGWYPFDPTPGFLLPVAMEQNAPRPEIPISQQDLPPQGPAALREQPSEIPSDLQDPAQDPGGAAERTGWVWALLVFAPLTLLVVPVAKRLLLARGRPEDLYRDLTGRLRDVLAPGRGSIADSPALTPTERILILAGAAGLDEGPFKAFARAYSDHLYSPAPGRDVGRAYWEARRELELLPRWRRVLGAFNPASLAARTKNGLAVAKKRLGKSLRGKLRWRGRKKRR